MALCPKCGSPVADGAKFCGACGASITPAGIPPVAASSPPSSVPPPSGAQGGISPNVAGLLIYIPFCLIGLVCAILFGFLLEPYKNNRYIRFHAWQSIALYGCWLTFFFGAMAVIHILAIVIHFILLLAIPLYLFMIVGWLVIMIMLMIKANGGEMYKMPVVGDWAEQQANR
jgi:uncharacterized membrane protein